uniref:Replication-associated protein n=1 Tax=Luscinia sibilans CRESS-DNA-virus sp. TaxID=2815041 RepID=A0A8A4XCT4_9VIRU|nr:MAG: replication-associated protein [Luscinia sibilans CRESS-DNA-virus sp.]
MEALLNGLQQLINQHAGGSLLDSRPTGKRTLQPSDVQGQPDNAPVKRFRSVGGSELSSSRYWFGTYIPAKTLVAAHFESFDPLPRIPHDHPLNSFGRKLEQLSDLRYYKYKWEFGSTGGSKGSSAQPCLHMHYYVVFIKQVRERQARSILAVADSQYLSIAQHPDRCIKYIEKPDESVSDVYSTAGGDTEFDENTLGAGPTADQAVLDFIKTGVSYKSVCEKFPSYCFRNAKKVKDGVMAHEFFERTSAPLVIVLWGHTNAGKSYLADKMDTLHNTYRKNLDKWFDGYAGERTCIFDDFDPNECISPVTRIANLKALLTMLDRYSNTRVEVKGHSFLFRADLVIISTNYNPQQWATGHHQEKALARRLHVVREYDREYNRLTPEVRNYSVRRCQIPYDVSIPERVLPWMPEIRKYLKLYPRSQVTDLTPEAPEGSALVEEALLDDDLAALTYPVPEVECP